MTDPRLRQRVEVVPVRPGVKPGITNDELLHAFMRSTKLSKTALQSYSASIKDFMRFMTREDGREIPVREWTKDAIWAHLHFVEANYCASFQSIPFKKDHSICKQRVWIGGLPVATAAQTHCRECPKFKRPMVQHRVNGLSKFFKYLARVGAISHNIMSDVVSEWWEENTAQSGADERRRNPSIDEMVRLVNGTAHPQRRAFYATSAKWWFRPNEMFLLDRYASFGIRPPAGVGTPVGFDDGFPRHPHLKSFDEGGDLVYLPKKPGRPDKRHGNRWLVIDSELRPILDQHFAWWERTVRRDKDGKAATTSLWLTSVGTPLQQHMMYRSLFHDDCLRLGLVTKEELDNPLRVWTAHCQRHFGEKVLETHNVPDNWCNHFRGDKLRDARGHYYKPNPEEVRQKYHEWVPILGFQPIANEPTLYEKRSSERDAHMATLADEIQRVRSQRRRLVQSASVRITGAKESLVMPRRIVAAVLFALKVESPDDEFVLEPDRGGSEGREFDKIEILALCERGLATLRHAGGG